MKPEDCTATDCESGVARAARKWGSDLGLLVEVMSSQGSFIFASRTGSLASRDGTPVRRSSSRPGSVHSDSESAGILGCPSFAATHDHLLQDGNV